MKSSEINKLAEALSAAQAMMEGAKKDKQNPFFKSSYADLASVCEAIREPFAINKLSVSQPVDVTESGRMVLKTILMHASGQYIESKMLLPDIPDPQKLGSALTYFRRYMLMALAGVAAEDDDGNEANRSVDRSRISEQKAREIITFIGNDRETLNEILGFCKISHIAELKTNQIETVKKIIKSRKEKKDEKEVQASDPSE